ncbi:MAG TPA: SCP2 sterol-binding domain-containing protein [Saprospiraceae bacterium]|nr:SCP2 sterol-binding domain-containing protein [Saprospiraceae bacterium]
MTTREILYSLPAKVNPQAIEGLETLFHFDIDGDHGGQFTVQVANGEVKVTDGLSGEPKCVVRASDENFVSVLTGALNPMMAILTGKLKISNQSEMLKYAKLFGLM